MCDKIIQDMFNKYNLTRFESTSVKQTDIDNSNFRIYGSKITNPPELKCSYYNNGINITYHSRLTTHLGDTDTFTDYSISINGIKIVDITYE